MIKSLLKKMGDDLLQLGGYQYLHLKEIDLEDKDRKFKDVFVLSKNRNDYYIFLTIETINLDEVNDLYQIELNTYLERAIAKKKSDIEMEFSLSDRFNKNRTLILIVQNVSDTPSIRKKISEIEEDPYFFKKQVLSLSENEGKKISTLISAPSILKKCEEIVTDSKGFSLFRNELKENLIIESALYSLVIKLYEKLPFLSLCIKEEESENLAASIDGQLDDNLISLRNKVLSLDSDNMQNFFESFCVQPVKESKDD